MSVTSSIRNVEAPFAQITWFKRASTPRSAGRPDLHVVRERQLDKYEELAMRRRRAQIAARHALGVA